jgi:hypothetical protein
MTNVPKNTVFPLNFDVFVAKSDEKRRIVQRCFALSLPHRIRKMHILMINSRHIQPKNTLSDRFLGGEAPL